jgi:uncharacterized protein DUF5675
MELTLRRIDFDDQSTVGELYIDDEPQKFCFTLELPNKDGMPGSCIPQGIYPVVLAPSPKFQIAADPWVLRYAGLMPHVIQIPNRTNILIHWGNDPHATEGCILVGLNHPSQDFIGSSRAAFEQLHAKIAAADKCTIEVIGGARSDVSVDIRSETVGDA